MWVDEVKREYSVNFWLDLSLLVSLGLQTKTLICISQWFSILPSSFFSWLQCSQSIFLNPWPLLTTFFLLWYRKPRGGWSGRDFLSPTMKDTGSLFPLSVGLCCRKVSWVYFIMIILLFPLTVHSKHLAVIQNCDVSVSISLGKQISSLLCNVPFSPLFKVVVCLATSILWWIFEKSLIFRWLIFFLLYVQKWQLPNSFIYLFFPPWSHSTAMDPSSQPGIEPGLLAMEL